MIKSRIFLGTPRNGADYRMNDWLEKNPGVEILKMQFAMSGEDHWEGICILYDDHKAPEEKETEDTTE